MDPEQTATDHHSNSIASLSIVCSLRSRCIAIATDTVRESTELDLEIENIIVLNRLGLRRLNASRMH